MKLQVKIDEELPRLFRIQYIKHKTTQCLTDFPCGDILRPLH